MHIFTKNIKADTLLKASVLLHIFKLIKLLT